MSHTVVDCMKQGSVFDLAEEVWETFPAELNAFVDISSNSGSLNSL